MATPLKKLLLPVSAELHAAIKTYAAENRTTMRAVMESAITTVLKKGTKSHGK